MRKLKRKLILITMSFIWFLIMIDCGCKDEAEERIRGVLGEFARRSKLHEMAATIWLVKEVVISTFRCVDVSKFTYKKNTEEED